MYQDYTNDGYYLNDSFDVDNFLSLTMGFEDIRDIMIEFGDGEYVSDDDVEAIIDIVKDSEGIIIRNAVIAALD